MPVSRRPSPGAPRSGSSRPFRALSDEEIDDLEQLRSSSHDDGAREGVLVSTLHQLADFTRNSQHLSRNLALISPSEADEEAAVAQLREFHEFDCLAGQAGKPEAEKKWAIDFSVEGEAAKPHRAAAIDGLVRRRSWSPSDALAYTCLQAVRNGMARAVRDRDASFAACTYALCDALYRNRAPCLHDDDTPPLLYKHLRGTFSLTEDDPSWAELLVPDVNGFCGLTSSAMLRLTREAKFFTPDGFAQRFMRGGAEVFEPMHSEVIGFESKAGDLTGVHAATLVDAAGKVGSFPPNCLFRVKEVKAPGTWRSPAGNYPNVQLIVVTATYRPAGSKAEATGAGKLCGGARMLTYGSRQAYITGLNDFLHEPMLTMPQEFDRRYSWTDWKGVRYTLRECWAYVNGPARAQEGCTPGHRDQHNNGKTPTLTAVNARRASRRTTSSESSQARCSHSTRCSPCAYTRGRRTNPSTTFCGRWA